jgi:hypothetical protein
MVTVVDVVLEFRKTRNGNFRDDRFVLNVEVIILWQFGWEEDMVDQIRDSLSSEDLVVGSVTHRDGGDVPHLQVDGGCKIRDFNEEGMKRKQLPSWVS